MFSKKCLYCSKDIPSTITVCPYCRRDEKGQDVSAVEQAPAALDAQVKADLSQLESEDPFERRNAAERLSQRGPVIVPLLVNRLNEHHHKGLSEVAKVLGRLRDERAKSALLQALKIGDEDLHASAVWALSQFSDSQILEELIRESERANPVIQGFLAHRLAGYQDARVVPQLMKLARHSNREVSFQAVWSLGEVGDPTAISFLRRLLGQKDALTKAVAETALRRLGGPIRRVYPVLQYVIGGTVVAGSALAALLWYYYR